MQSTKYSSGRHSKRGLKNSDGKLLYDARGVRVQKKKFSGGFYNTLLYWVLPFLVINLLIFTLVTSTPKIDVTIADTHDYKTTTVTFNVKSLLPLKGVTALREYTEPIELSKDGNTYTAQITRNGNITLEATSVNGMSTRVYENIDILDSTPPQINPDDCEIGNDKLTLKISDSQSGVNFDSIYAVDPLERTITPSYVDRDSGTVEFAMYLDSLEVYAEDMVGNPVQANFSTTNAYKLSQEQNEGAEASSDESASDEDSSHDEAEENNTEENEES